MEFGKKKFYTNVVKTYSSEGIHTKSKLCTFNQIVSELITQFTRRGSVASSFKSDFLKSTRAT